MKLYLFVFICIVSTSFCNSLDKEKLDLEKEKLEFEKSKLEFEKQKLNSCCCCKTESKTVLKEQPIVNTELYIPPKQTKDCESIEKYWEGDIWSLSVDGNWFYPPYSIKKGAVCQEDKKEFFYKQFSNTESYVAEKQVPSTKKSSCINNVLFYGKSPLYHLMFDKSSQTRVISVEEKKKYIEKLVEYNNEEKGRSFFYECKPTDKLKKWDSCTCVLYASYPNGEKGIQNLIQK
jgi:hypothetical protein